MATNKASFYPYSPSKAAAIISVITFAVLLATHVFKLFKTRTWFAIPFVIGAIFETLGYLARAYGFSHPTDLNPYVAQALLILLAPLLFAASIYMFLGRIIRATGHSELSVIRPSWLTKIFLLGDVFCFLIQAAGAGLLAKSDATSSQKDLGKYSILAGLILQLLLFGFFVFVAAIFHMRAHKAEGTTKAVSRFQWRKYLFMLYGTSGLITVRNLFRVAEYAMGEDGYLLAHEWPLYIFDALLMAIALAIFVTWYVGDIVSDNIPGRGEDMYVMMAGHQSRRTQV